MAIRPGCICAFGFVVFVSACGSVDINRLDSNLADAYRDKQTVWDEDEQVIGADGIRGRFAEIAKEAEEAAEKLDSDDLLNRTSLYRIAATARWQSLDLPVVIENTDSETGGSTLPSTFAYTATVKDLCERKWRDDRKVKEILPRDCLLVEFIPDIADGDGAFMKFEAAAIRLATIPNEKSSQTQDRLQTVLDDFRSAYATMRNVLVEITKSRNANLATPVPASFWRWVDRQRLSAYCNARRVTVAFADITVEVSDETENCIKTTQIKMSDGLSMLKGSLESSFENIDCKELKDTASTWLEKSILPGATQAVADDFADLKTCSVSQ